MHENTLADHSSAEKVGGYPDNRTCPYLSIIYLGKFLHEEFLPARTTEDTVPSLEANERDAFLSFVRGMLTWLPEERKPARQLMEDPFLKFKND